MDRPDKEKQAGKSDAQIAAELRLELAPLIGQVCEIMDHAKQVGITVNFNIAPDMFGRSAATVHIVKAL